MLYELEGVRPRIAPDAYVAPDATVIGNVWLGARSSIWFKCLVRGDTNRIRIGDRTNIQDCSIIHVNPGEDWVTEIGNDVTVGHGCIIHACKLLDRAFVGMGATVLDGAVIEEGAMLAAGGNGFGTPKCVSQRVDGSRAWARWRRVLRTTSTTFSRPSRWPLISRAIPKLTRSTCRLSWMSSSTRHSAPAHSYVSSSRLPAREPRL